FMIGSEMMNSTSQTIRTQDLPPTYRDQIFALEQELEEGDITKKGFEKKRLQVIQEYLQNHGPVSSQKKIPSPITGGDMLPVSSPISPPQQQSQPQQQQQHQFQSPSQASKPWLKKNDSWFFDGNNNSYEPQGSSVSRQSTVYGYRKPGIDFGQLLANDLESGDAGSIDVPAIPERYMSMKSPPQDVEQPAKPHISSYWENSISGGGDRQTVLSNTDANVDYHSYYANNNSNNNNNSNGQYVRPVGGDAGAAKPGGLISPEPSPSENFGNHRNYYNGGGSRYADQPARPTKNQVSPQKRTAVKKDQSTDFSYRPNIKGSNQSRPQSKQSHVSAKTQHSTVTADVHDSPIESVTINDLLYASYSTPVPNIPDSHVAAATAANKDKKQDTSTLNTTIGTDSKRSGNAQKTSLSHYHHQQDPSGMLSVDTRSTGGVSTQMPTTSSIGITESENSEQSVGALFLGLEREYENAMTGFGNMDMLPDIGSNLYDKHRGNKDMNSNTLGARSQDNGGIDDDPYKSLDTELDMKLDLNYGTSHNGETSVSQARGIHSQNHPENQLEDSHRPNINTNDQTIPSPQVAKSNIKIDKRLPSIRSAQKPGGKTPPYPNPVAQRAIESSSSNHGPGGANGKVKRNVSTRMSRGPTMYYPPEAQNEALTTFQEISKKYGPSLNKEDQSPEGSVSGGEFGAAGEEGQPPNPLIVDVPVSPISSSAGNRDKSIDQHSMIYHTPGSPSIKHSRSPSNIHGESPRDEAMNQANIVANGSIPTNDADNANDDAVPFFNNTVEGPGGNEHPGMSINPVEALPPGSGSIVYPREIPENVITPKLRHITSSFNNIASILFYRARTTPRGIAYTCIDGKGKEVGSWTWQKLHQRAERIMQLLRHKGVVCKGDRVALVYRKYEMLDFVGSLFGCFYAGMCAVPIVAGDSYSELVHVLNSTGSQLVLTTELNIKALNKDLHQSSVSKLWPSSVAWVRTDHLGGPIMSSTVNSYGGSSASNPSPLANNASGDKGTPNHAPLSPGDIAYIEFSKSPNGELKGVQVTHGAIMTQSIGWVMSAGLLGVGRVPIKTSDQHQSELTADDAAVLSTPVNHDAESSKSLVVRDGRSMSQGGGSTVAERLIDSRGRSSSSSNSFLNKLKNAGSLVNIRRKISRTRSKELSMVVTTPQLYNSTNAADSIRSLPGPSANKSATKSTATTVGGASPPRHNGSTPLAVSTSNFAHTPSHDVLVSYVEPRQHLGLTLGILVGAFGGHQSIYVSSTLLEMPGAFIHLLTKYNATIVVSDYSGLQSVLSTATDEPDQILNYNKKVLPNLSMLRSILIDTLYIDHEFHRMFNNAVLHPFGCPYQQIREREHHPVIMPVCTLAEHGSILLSMNDTLSRHPPPNISIMKENSSSEGDADADVDDIDGPSAYKSLVRGILHNEGNDKENGSNEIWEYVLDREALKDNRIVTLPDEKGEDGLDKPGTVRYPVFGYPALQSTVAVVDPETRELCPSNSVGELWIDTPCLGSGFWGLPKLTNSIFSARFYHHVPDPDQTSGLQIGYDEDGNEIVEDTGMRYKLVQSEQVFLRTGLMGALVGGKVMVFGFYEDRIRSLTLEMPPGMPAEEVEQLQLQPWSIEPRLSFHYAGDITNTIKHLRPQVSECTAFEMFVNETHLPVIVAEVRPNVGAYAALADEIYNDVKNRHGLYPSCIALCNMNTLPRAFQYGKRTVNAQICRHHFETGQVRCIYTKLCTENLFLNLPPPASEFNVDDFVEPEDPSILLYGQWLQQTSLEESFPSVDERSGLDLKRFSLITEILIWRASTTPKETAFTQFDVRGRPVKSVTFEKLLLKVSNLAHYLCDKKSVGPGDHVLVVIMPGLDFVYAIHACLAIGAIPIPVAPPDVNRLTDDLVPILVTASEFKVRHMLVNSQSEEIMKHKNIELALKAAPLKALLGRTPILPVMIRIFKAPKSARPILGQDTFKPSPVWADHSRPALIMQFTGSQPATPQYVSVSHPSIMAYCSQQKSDFQMLSNHPVITSVRAYNGYGLLHCAMIGIYVGCPSLLLNAVDYFTNPIVWFDLVCRYKVKDAFSTLPMLQHAMNFIKGAAQPRSFSLHNVRNLIVATEERVDPKLYATIRDFFSVNRLEETALNPLYGTLMNPCISTRAYLGVRPLTLRLDLQALRRGKVWVLPLDNQEDLTGAEMYSLVLQDSGKVSGSTMVAIVDPVTRSVLPAGHVGEIWVYSNSNALQRQTLLPPGTTLPGSHGVPHSRAISTNTTGKLDSEDPVQAGFDFVRTGDLGFLYLDVSSSKEGEGDENGPTPAEPYLFVIGKISETLNINGYMYFITDIEKTIECAHHDLLAQGCTIIQTTVPPAKSPGASVKLDNVDSPSYGKSGAGTDPNDCYVRTVAVVSIRRDPRECHIPNAACLIFNAVLDSHQILLDEIVFVPKEGLPRSRIPERKRRTVRALYEHARLRVLAAYQITHQQHMMSRHRQVPSSGIFAGSGIHGSGESALGVDMNWAESMGLGVSMDSPDMYRDSRSISPHPRIGSYYDHHSNTVSSHHHPNS
ncbi:hypothetical protein H4219_005520, partial [Mycoemilia scoparia]